MDNYQFNPAYHQYNAPPNASSQQSSNPPSLGSFGGISAPGHPQSPSTHTLPPLQGHNAGFSQFGSLSYPHMSSQPPGSSVAQHSNRNSAMAGESADHGFTHASPTTVPGPLLPPASFANAYSMNPSMYPSSSASSMPPATTSAGLPTIQPMPPGGVGAAANGLAGMGGSHQLAHMGQQGSFMQNEDAPTHVVGSQGRRGILPSAPGRPDAPTQGSAQITKSLIPQKDAEGKYPCMHCPKTYLHAKHLKRHLLRHTGDRPYMCHLCKDTFSRSDILKRHFQKCSLRRGNPTGANHLAHQRKHQNNSMRLSIGQQDGPIGLASLPEVAGNATYNGNMVAPSPTGEGDMSTRTSRANSLISPGTISHRNSVAGLGILGSAAPSNESIGTSASYHPPMSSSYAMQSTTNGGPMSSNYAFNVSQLNGNLFNSANNPSGELFFNKHGDFTLQQQPPEHSEHFEAKW